MGAGLQPPAVYALQMMALEGVPPTAPPSTQKHYIDLMTVIQTMLTDAQVLPLPSLVAPTGGGPVTGVGSLK